MRNPTSKRAIELPLQRIGEKTKKEIEKLTHNSKIRELSDGNRVMKTELSFAKQSFCRGSHHF